MQKIRKGDEVIVITGRDKGKRGTVLRRVDDAHLVVEGINIVKKHVRPNPMKGETGGIVEKSMPIDQQGWSCRHQGARGWPQGAGLQVQWRTGERLRVNA